MIRLGPFYTVPKSDVFGQKQRQKLYKNRIRPATGKEIVACLTSKPDLVVEIQGR
jgi:hypothetical protein